MNRDTKRFVDEYFKELIAGNAAIFAGAGLSVPAGYVDWRELLRPLAEELDLDIDRESDLIAVAQFHVNANASNRHRLHQAIIEALSADNPPTVNHEILARLPIATWWTTNYDKLIETALKAAGRVADVKSDVPQLANTRPRRDAIVYKMHGDVDHPDKAVVTRDDYERYARDRGAFINALSGDLVSKTFLFIGFSFTDPNLEQVFARLRITYEHNQRRHFAVFRKRTQLVDEDAESFEHARVRQALVVEDLKRFNVRAIFVDEYDDITEMLSELERKVRRQTVFVSASAADFSPWGEGAVTSFLMALGKEFASRNIRIATGFGLGAGAALFAGAASALPVSALNHLEDHLVLRPFPQTSGSSSDRKRLWTAYRREILKSAGLALFLFGNKSEGAKFALADGMQEEFDLAQELGVLPLPIAATGSMAANLWKSWANDLGGALSVDQRRAIESLAIPTDDLNKLVRPIVDLVADLREDY